MKNLLKIEELQQPHIQNHMTVLKNSTITPTKKVTALANYIFSNLNLVERINTRSGFFAISPVDFSYTANWMQEQGDNFTNDTLEDDALTVINLIIKSYNT
jgi:hypothetical protein